MKSVVLYYLLLGSIIFCSICTTARIVKDTPATLTSGMQSKEDIDGMIGNNFLKRFNLVIDFKNNKLILKPNKFLYSPFYDFLLP